MSYKKVDHLQDGLQSQCKINSPVALSNLIHKSFKEGRRCVLHHGNCFELLPRIRDELVNLTISSPPYCMGKEYESSIETYDFIEAHEKLIPEIYRITKQGGSICWQVGYHVKKGQVMPLDYLAFDVFRRFPDLKLRNRIIWNFAHGLHGTKRFSGRHETILWFTKGDDYKFDLDSVRVPQRYPGKIFYKGKNKGKLSSNPLGKNPSDVWDLPVVNANHVEKTAHPCQFPQALAQRLILALSKPDDLVFDPFMGSGTTGAAAISENRAFIGSEIEKKYWEISYDRIESTMNGSSKYRPLDKPVQEPNPNHKVARKPLH